MRPGRVIPEPFKRPRLDLDSNGPKREWRWITPGHIQPGDILQHFGKVKAIKVLDNIKGLVEVIHAIDPDRSEILDLDEKVYTFTTTKPVS